MAKKKYKMSKSDAAETLGVKRGEKDIGVIHRAFLDAVNQLKSEGNDPRDIQDELDNYNEAAKVLSDGISPTTNKPTPARFSVDSSGNASDIEKPVSYPIPPVSAPTQRSGQESTVQKPTPARFSVDPSGNTADLEKPVESAPQSKRVPLNPLPMPQVKQPSSQMPPMPQAKPTTQPPPSTTAQPSQSYVSFMQQPITTGASAPDVSSQNGQGMSDFKDAVREFRDAIREVKQLIQAMAGQGSQQGAGGFRMPPGGLPIPKQTVPRTSGDRNDRVPSVMSGQALGFLAQVFRALS